MWRRMSDSLTSYKALSDGDHIKCQHHLFTSTSHQSECVLIIKCKYLQMMYIVIITNNAGGLSSRGAGATTSPPAIS